MNKLAFLLSFITHNIKFTLIIAVPIVIAACSDNDLPDRNADEAAIRALLATNQAATNRHDADGVVATYLPNGDIWIVGNPRISGLDEIRRNEIEFYNTPGFQSWKITIEEIRFISTDAALVESTGATNLDTETIEEQATWVVSRRNYEWRIAAVRIMVFSGSVNE